MREEAVALERGEAAHLQHHLFSKLVEFGVEGAVRLDLLGAGAQHAGGDAPCLADALNLLSVFQEDLHKTLRSC